MLPATDQPPPEETGFWQPYSEFAKTLRTWFGYGVGAPALVLSQAEIRKPLLASGQLPVVGWLFLSGVLLQVLLAFVYKTAMWELYLGEMDPSLRTRKRHRLANAISEATALEIAADLLTITLFALATIIAFRNIS